MTTDTPSTRPDQGATRTRYGSDDHAVQLLRVSASARGRTHAWNAVAVLHVRDGKFSECWIHVDDQYALDEFLNSLAAEPARAR